MGMDFYPSDDKSTTSNVIIDGKYTILCDSIEYIIKLSNMQSKLCFLVSSVLPFEVEVDKKKGLYNSEFRAIYVEKHLF